MFGERNSHVKTRHSHRRGFTLVELLVVIVIITILAGLTTTAVFRVMKTAKEAKISLEIAGIQKALEKYKMEMGSYPPDFAIPAPGSGTHAEAVAFQINQHLKRAYRYRNANGDFPASLDANRNGTFEASELALLSRLDPSEAIYFWLQGFSADKQRPIYGRAAQMAGAGLTPLFSFDKARLADIDGDGFPEYYAAGLDQTPYIYYRSDRSMSPNGYYNHVFAWHKDIDSGKIAEAFVAPEKAAKQAGGHLPNPYFRNLSGTISYAETERFQLISAGLDGLYGVGGIVDNSNTPIGGFFPTGPYGNDPSGIVEGDKDNITSFSEGHTLEGSIP